jgi:hypothetical protein
MKRLFDLDDEDVPFIRRWNALSRVLLVEPSVKLVARLAMDYADFDDGSSCFPSIERMTRETGISDRTVRNAWAVMRGIKMAVRVSRGGSYRGHADEYRLQIPNDWRSLPLLGPHCRKFTCPGCGKLFNPDSHSRLNERPEDKGKDVVRWTMGRLTFCSWPNESGRKGSTECLTAFDTKRRQAGEKPFRQMGSDVWKVFWEARNDHW